MGLFAVSCTEPIDFDQAEDLVLTPEFDATLIDFNQSASGFIVDEKEVSVVQDIVGIEIFSNKYVVDNLDAATLVFETQNTINRAFELTVEFLDRSNTVQHRFTVEENAAVDGTDAVSVYTEVFEGNILLALKRSVSIVYTLKMLSGPPITASTTGAVIYKSFATFKINIEK